MLNKNYTYLFLFLMMLGTLISISASSWFIAWLGLEINLTGFIPILMNKNFYKNYDSAIKYFIIQTISSSLIIFSSVLNMTLSNSFFTYYNPILIFFALLIKMAAAPFHMWLPQLTENFNWPQLFISLSWQKIAPLWLITNLNLNNWMVLILISSAIMGAISGILLNSIKQIIVFSSISQSSWFLTAIIINKTIWTLYFLIYLFMILLLMSLSIVSNFNLINKISSKTLNPSIKMNFIMMIFSIAGLPPFLGFVSKLIIIQFLLTHWSNFILIPSLLMAALLSLFFYLKMILSLMLNPIKFKFNLMKFNPSDLNLFTILNVTGNLISPIFWLIM